MGAINNRQLPIGSLLEQKLLNATNIDDQRVTSHGKRTGTASIVSSSSAAKPNNRLDYQSTRQYNNNLAQQPNQDLEHQNKHYQYASQRKNHGQQTNNFFIEQPLSDKATTKASVIHELIKNQQATGENHEESHQPNERSKLVSSQNFYTSRLIKTSRLETEYSQNQLLQQTPTGTSGGGRQHHQGNRRRIIDASNIVFTKVGENGGRGQQNHFKEDDDIDPDVIEDKPTFESEQQLNPRGGKKVKQSLTQRKLVMLRSKNNPQCNKDDVQVNPLSEAEDTFNTVMQRQITTEIPVAPATVQKRQQLRNQFSENSFLSCDYDSPGPRQRQGFLKSGKLAIQVQPNHGTTAAIQNNNNQQPNNSDLLLGPTTVLQRLSAQQQQNSKHQKTSQSPFYQDNHHHQNRNHTTAQNDRTTTGASATKHVLRDISKHDSKTNVRSASQTTVNNNINCSQHNNNHQAGSLVMSLQNADNTIIGGAKPSSGSGQLALGVTALGAASIGTSSNKNLSNLQQKFRQSLASCQIKGKKITLENNNSGRQTNNQDSAQSMQPMDQLSNQDSHRKSNRSSKNNKNNNQSDSTSKQLIAIKIVDVDKTVVKTFIAKKEIIVSQMKYFSKHLQSKTNAASAQRAKTTATTTTTNTATGENETNNEIVDIQVCCDALIFKFLLDYCTELHKNGAVGENSEIKLTHELLFPVLVSSVFLQIEKLIKQCVLFWKKNFDKIMREVSIPVSQLEQSIFGKLCEAIDQDKLLKLEQQNQLANAVNNNLSQKQVVELNQDMAEKMFMYYALRLIDDESFMTCQFCSEIYPVAHAHKLKCSAHHDFFVDNSENSIQMHVADQQLDLEQFCEYLHHEQDMPWKLIFGKVLARTIILPRCQVCLDKTTSAFLQSCNSHLGEPCFTGGAHIGVYPCCGQHVIRAAYDQHKEEVQRLTKVQESRKARMLQQEKNSNNQKTSSHHFEPDYSNSASQPKLCTQPLGCHVQDHSINWRKFSSEEILQLDFLRLTQIAPHVFETKSTKQDNSRQKKDYSLATLVQQYRQDMIGVIRNAQYNDDGVQIEIPHELNSQMNEELSPTAQARRQQRLLGFAYGGIVEQFEDDFDSDDSEFLYQKCGGADRGRGAGQDNKGRDESWSKVGLSTQTSTTGVAKQIAQAQENASVEQTLLASWNVDVLTKKKVRKAGRDIIYSFKFNMITKEKDAPKFFTKLRDERLRAIAEQDKDNNKESLLAIPSSKELFVKKKDYSSFSKSYVSGEQTNQQTAFDLKRLEQMTAQMMSMRQRESSSVKQSGKDESNSQIKAQHKQQKSEREIIVQQRNAVNRLALNKEQQSASFRIPRANNIFESSHQNTVLLQPTTASQSRVDQNPIQHHHQQQPPTLQIATSNIALISQQSSTTTKKRGDVQSSLKTPTHMVPIAVQAYSYMSPQNVNNNNNFTSAQQTQHVSAVPSQFQQKILTPGMISASVVPQNITQRITRASHNQPPKLSVATAQSNALRNNNHQTPLTSNGSRTLRSSLQAAAAQSSGVAVVGVPVGGSGTAGAQRPRATIAHDNRDTSLTGLVGEGIISQEYVHNTNKIQPQSVNKLVVLDKRLLATAAVESRPHAGSLTGGLPSSPTKINRGAHPIGGIGSGSTVTVKLVNRGEANNSRNNGGGGNFFQSSVQQSQQAVTSASGINSLSQNQMSRPSATVQLKQPPGRQQQH